MHGDHWEPNEMEIRRQGEGTASQSFGKPKLTPAGVTPCR